MSRFVNLEFGSQAGEQSPADDVANVVKDESFYQREAQTAFESADFQKALRSYAKVLEFNPQNAAAWTAQVRMLLELDQSDEAQSWADKALERFPREADLLAVKAVVLARFGDTQSALAFSDAAVAENGASPYVWLARGDVLLAARATLADYCIDKALMLAPGDWVMAWQGARIRIRHGQFSLAGRLLQKAVEWNPAHFLPWLELGRCQEALGLKAAARKSFTQASELNPQNAVAAQALARLSASGSGNPFRGWWRRLKK
jgi:tetratricopeptide (TPR) repeat protein